MTLIDALLDSWDRNNRVLVNLLRAIPEDGFDCRATPTSPSVGAMFMHIHYCRLVLVQENVPEIGVDVPENEWVAERDIARMANMLNDSAKVARDALASRLASGKPMNRHYDHPILFLQHMIWHEGYHHGQIKLALKLGGRPVADEVAGPITWHVYFDKT